MHVVYEVSERLLRMGDLSKIARVNTLKEAEEIICDKLYDSGYSLYYGYTHPAAAKQENPLLSWEDAWTHLLPGDTLNQKIARIWAYLRATSSFNFFYPEIDWITRNLAVNLQEPFTSELFCNFQSAKQMKLLLKVWKQRHFVIELVAVDLAQEGENNAGL